MEEKGKNTRKKMSSFSVILTMVLLILVGMSVVPLLNISYVPTKKEKSLSISFHWPGTAARVVEQEITSKIEGILSTVKGIEKINSVSRKNSGQVTVTYKDNVNTDALRFEISTLLKQLHPGLPEKAGIPVFSGNSSGESTQTLLTYLINAPYTPDYLRKYADEHIVPVISKIEGVHAVNVYGDSPYEWQIRFDPVKCNALQITPGDISSAINDFNKKEVVGLVISRTNTGDTLNIPLYLTGIYSSSINERESQESSIPQMEMLENIPVINREGRSIYLKDICQIKYTRSQPKSYQRINGLNNLSLSISAESDANILKVSRDVKEQMQFLERHYPEHLNMILSYDASTEIKKELRRVFLRMVVTTLILLLFVFLVKRESAYLIIIILTLVANIFIAFIFYHLLNLEIHLYSLAGITVSLGLIIDSSIIMIDHFYYYRNRKVFLSILAALLTTVGALSIVFFLPDFQKDNLRDFAVVIIINLIISLFIALFFIPSLIDKIPLRKKTFSKKIKRRRKIVYITDLYRRFILQLRKPWSRRLLILLLILGFGLPVYLLPEKIYQKDSYQERKGFFPELYNNTIGSDFYQRKIKKITDPALGGMFRLFSKKIISRSSFEEPTRTKLYVRAAIPEGRTIQHLNDIVLRMENFLSQFEDIERYQTNISTTTGMISISFPSGKEKEDFPEYLKELIVAEAQEMGGADWSVWGVGQAFSNSSPSQEYLREYKLILKGYNYNQLYQIAEEIADRLNARTRIREAEIFTNEQAMRVRQQSEFTVNFHPESLVLQDASVGNYYKSFTEKMYSSGLNSILTNHVLVPATLESTEKEHFDLWNLTHQVVTVNDRPLKFSELGKVEKKKAGNDIYKFNQEYTLYIAYDFVGSRDLGEKVREEICRDFNQNLPIGFKLEVDDKKREMRNNREQYLFIFLIVVIIYILCSILFESLWQPLLIIMIIPVSFIGVFLIFWLFNFSFDQGGYASFVLLCGITVNTGIYIVNEYNILSRGNTKGIHVYMKAYNRKIVPITLTVISTVLGMIPFLIYPETFWFSFAIGTIGGTIFSLLALFIFIPSFIRWRR